MDINLYGVERLALPLFVCFHLTVLWMLCLCLYISFNLFDNRLSSPAFVFGTRKFVISVD